MSDEPLTQEEYTAHVFLLMGQFIGTMSRAERGNWLPDDVVEDLWQIFDKMTDLYFKSKRAGL